MSYQHVDLMTERGYKQVPMTADMLVHQQKHNEQFQPIFLSNVDKKQGQVKQMENSMKQIELRGKIRERLLKKLSDRKKEAECKAE